MTLLFTLRWTHVKSIVDLYELLERGKLPPGPYQLHWLRVGLGRNGLSLFQSLAMDCTFDLADSLMVSMVHLEVQKYQRNQGYPHSYLLYHHKFSHPLFLLFFSFTFPFPQDSFLFLNGMVFLALYYEWLNNLDVTDNSELSTGFNLGWGWYGSITTSVVSLIVTIACILTQD